jgi:hypothetical protein
VRGTTALLVTVLLLLVVAVGADALVTRTAEAQAAQRVGAELGAPASVDLRGWPVSLRLLQGTVPEVDIRATDVPLPDADARLSVLEASVTNVRVGFTDLRGDGDLPVDGGSGTFRAEVTEADVANLAGLPGALTLAEGVGVVASTGVPIEVIATVDAGVVVLRPLAAAPGLQPVRLAPLALPGEATLDAVRILPGRLELTGRILRLAR